MTPTKHKFHTGTTPKSEGLPRENRDRLPRCPASIGVARLEAQRAQIQVAADGTGGARFDAVAVVVVWSAVMLRCLSSQNSTVRNWRLTNVWQRNTARRRR